MEIYKLTHQRHIEYKLHTAEWVTDTKLIGFFVSEDLAKEAKISLLDKPGFRDYPDDFTIDKYTLDGDTDTVYLVEHSYYIEDDRIDNIVEIGVFAEEADAMSAAAEYEKTARFPVGTHSWDEDFDIDNYLSVAKYILGEMEFTEGFIIG